LLKRGSLANVAQRARDTYAWVPELERAAAGLRANLE
jgi:hypothetical protein